MDKENNEKMMRVGQYLLRDRNILREKSSNSSMISQFSKPAKRMRRAISISSIEMPVASSEPKPAKRTRRVNSTSSIQKLAVNVDDTKLAKAAKRTGQVNITYPIQKPAVKTDDTKVTKPAKRMRRVNSTSSIEMSVASSEPKKAKRQLTDGPNSQMQTQPLTFESKKISQITFTNDEVKHLITHSCKLTNEKVQLRKKLVKHSEQLQKITDECKAEKLKCEYLKKILNHKQQQCKDLQSIIDLQFCTDLVQFDDSDAEVPTSDTRNQYLAELIEVFTDK